MMKWVQIYEQVCNNEANFVMWKHAHVNGVYGPTETKIYEAIVLGFRIWVWVNYRTHIIEDAGRNALPGGR